MSGTPDNTTRTYGEAITGHNAVMGWYAFLSWHGDSRKPSCGHWVMDAENRELPWQSPPAQSAAGFLRAFQAVGGTVTFNLFCYQDGSVYAPDLEAMKSLEQMLGR